MREYRYDSVYYDLGIGGFHQASFPEISRRFAAVAASGFGSVLDLGCGNGFYGPFLRQHARVVHGVDRSRAIADSRFRSAYDEVCSADLGSPWRAPRTYDAVFSVEVVEHVEDYRVFLRNAYDALSPGGTLFLTTSTYLCTLFVLLIVYRRQVSPAALADFARGLAGDESARTRFVGRLWDYLTGHYHGFSKTQLAGGLADVGFQLESIDHLHVQDTVPVGYLEQRYRGPLHYRAIVAAGVPALRWAGHAINWTFRTLDLYAPNIVVVARRPG